MTDFYARRIHFGAKGASTPDLTGVPFDDDIVILNTSEMGACPSTINETDRAATVTNVQGLLDTKYPGEYDAKIVMADIETWFDTPAAGNGVGEYYARVIADAIKAYRTQARTAAYGVIRPGLFIATDSANNADRLKLRAKIDRNRRGFDADHFIMAELFLYDDDQDNSDRHVDFVCSEAFREGNGRRPLIIYSPIFTAQAYGPLVDTWVPDALDTRVIERCLAWGCDVMIWGDIVGNLTDWETYVARYVDYAYPSQGSAPGSDTQMIFNNAGALGAISSVTWTSSTSTLTVVGNIVEGVNLGAVAKVYAYERFN